MDTLERATAPRDTSGLIVKPLTPTGMNLLPSSPSAAIRSGLPGTIIGQPDALRQFYSRIQSQQRLFQPLSKVATAAAAPAQVQARTAAMQVISGLTQNQVPGTPLYSRVPATLLNTLANIDLATYKGTWKPNILYKQGNEVEDAQYIWQASAENINSEPSRTNPNWNLVGVTTLKAFQGTYVGGSSYNAGEEVLQSGNIYQSLVDNNTQAPPGSQWQLIGPASLDNISEGSQYGKVIQTALTGGQVDLSKAGVINKILDYLEDSGTYAKVLVTALTNGQVDLSKPGVVNKVLDYIADSATWRKVAGVEVGNLTSSNSYSSSSISSYFTKSVNGTVNIAQGGTGALFTSDITTDNTGGSQYTFILQFSGVFDQSGGSPYPEIQFTADGGSPVGPLFLYPVGYGAGSSAITTVIFGWASNPGHSFNVNVTNQGAGNLAVYGTMGVLVLKA